MHDPDNAELNARDKLYELITKLVTGTSGPMKVVRGRGGARGRLTAEVSRPGHCLRSRQKTA